jgi:predicted outer membrane repeat protein
MGGAVYVEGTVNSFGSTFAANKATNLGGALYASSTATITVGRNTFAGNEAGQAGPSVFIDGGLFSASLNAGCDNAGCNGVSINDGVCLQFEETCIAPTGAPTVSIRKSTIV